MSTTDATEFFAQWGAQREMNELETAMWRGERHPSNSSTGVFVEFLEATPEWDRVVSAHEHFGHLVPRFKRRVMEPALPLAPPVWVDDENYDLAYHLRRASVPAPGTEQQLMELVQAWAVTPLDKTRAPWVAYLVEGLEGGRAAYVFIVHHCLMDGGALMQLLAAMQPRVARDEPLRPPLPEGGAPREPSGSIELAATQALGQLTGTPRKATQLVGSAWNIVRSGPAEAASFAASLGRMVSPPKATPSTLMNSGNRTLWRFATLTCELDELKAAGKAAGGTVNAAYVSAILGGVRRYHLWAGAPIEDIPMSMPVSVRAKDDASGGNRFAGAFLAAPTSVEDPAERILELGEVVKRIQGEPALDFFKVVLPGLNRTPSVLMLNTFTAMQGRADLTVSNVVGSPWPIHFAGTKVDRIGCWGALPGSAMTTVLCSYAGRCTIGINCDGGAFRDSAKLFAFLEESLQEVLDLGREAAR